MNFYIKVNDKNYQVPEEALGSEIKTFLKYSNKVGEKNIFDLSNVFKNYIFIYNIYNTIEDKAEIKVLEGQVKELEKLMEVDNGQTLPEKVGVLNNKKSEKTEKELEMRKKAVEIKQPEIKNIKFVLEDIMNICDNIKNYLSGYGITMFSTNTENEALYSKFLKFNVSINNRFKSINNKLEAETLEQNELKSIYHYIQVSFEEILETLNLLYNGDEHKKIK